MKFFKRSRCGCVEYIREDFAIFIESRNVRINGRWCPRWCVYGDCGENIIEMFTTLKAAKAAYANVQTL